MTISAFDPASFSKEERADLAARFAQQAAHEAIYQLWLRRKEEGWKQKSLGERIGRNVTWISRTLSGPGNWTLKSLGEMAEALDAEVEIRVTPREEIHAPNFDAYAEAKAQQAAALEGQAAATRNWVGIRRLSAEARWQPSTSSSVTRDAPIKVPG